MNEELTRLLDGEATEFERRLLASVRDEQPDAALEARMRLAIGLPVAGAGALGLRQRWESLGPTSQWAIGLGGAIAIGGAALLSFSRSAPHQPAPTEAPRPQLEAPASSVGAVDPAEAVEPMADPTPSSSLREEVRLLDGVRAALAQGRTAEASQLLMTYEERFPQGVLRPEADELRSQLE